MLNYKTPAEIFFENGGVAFDALMEQSVSHEIINKE
jgi:hypothetical protein